VLTTTWQSDARAQVSVLSAAGSAKKDFSSNRSDEVTQAILKSRQPSLPEKISISRGDLAGEDT
jgi:hypothetical protein